MSRQNFDKDSYIIDLEDPERAYWLVTESGLLGVFHFDGACTAGDGSSDVASHTMGADFCNLSALGWITGQHLAPPQRREQRELHSHRVDREEEGIYSNHPELVALRECLETHLDSENLLYLTDSEAILQAINRWIGGGSKLSLSRSPDGDVLKAIIIKL